MSNGGDDGIGGSGGSDFPNVSVFSSLNRQNMHAYSIESFTNQMSTGTLVKVTKFKYQQGQGSQGGQSGSQDQQQGDNGGEVKPTGWLEVQPLVNLLDGQGKPTKHDIIFNVPYYRLASGDQHIIMDPQKGDVGYMSFADRDISRVKKSLNQDNPGSRRRFDMADGFFHGIALTQNKPTSYVQFDNGKPRTINKSPDSGKTLSSITTGKVTHSIDQSISNGQITHQVDGSNGVITQKASGSNGQINHLAGSLLSRQITGSGNIQDSASSILHNGNTFVSQNLNVTQLVSAQNYNTFSDRRAKSHVKRIKGVLARALALPVRSFKQYACQNRDGRVRKRRGSAINSVGVIAQEVREVFPELVRGEEETDVLTVAESKIGIIALAALQELHQEMSAEISRLRTRITELERGYAAT